jgi:protein dpnD
MKEFEVEIVETSARRVVIKARNKEEACKIVRAAYESSEIVLGAEDFVCRILKRRSRTSRKLNYRDFMETNLM